MREKREIKVIKGFKDLNVAMRRNGEEGERRA